ncbi:hypothetical protein FRACYDRAFT_252584 [Fragilariopsis cylindrus CCMP1102]|uniref:Uncharacterized protein n=1 Tax=Fragilariopsis cylindrus CCMP1102 TaxID=635003 RepID=A0A1E7ELZ6_9STRA|nr:hypothetical protein FRACYDRAFT_252584 [Fragilariopsis cylindrus CCMP1102]|eukprot:OEU06952.1 hypothetical protein FRACYDRAFT_252584 [Fragilariopsis cylindrus CCMP1102]
MTVPRRSVEYARNDQACNDEAKRPPHARYTRTAIVQLIVSLPRLYMADMKFVMATSPIQVCDFEYEFVETKGTSSTAADNNDNNEDDDADASRETISENDGITAQLM